MQRVAPAADASHELIGTSKHAPVVQIEVRGEQLGRTKLDFGFVGDTKATLRALPRLKQNQQRDP